MKFKEKLKYISNRALVLGTVVFGSFIILAVIQLLLAYKGETPWWMAIIITIFAILFPIVFWLWIHRPYMRCEKMTDRFLDGYIFSEKEDMELLNLTPSIQKQMKMVDRIVRSPQYMDLNKRQAQYLALQNQINPHFLYNTLDSIIWMSEAGENDQVVLMTSALAKLLRQSISNDREQITVAEEIDYVRSYLTIQKMRYKDKLEYTIDVEERILDVRIIKFVLQPLVENAIYHGLKYKETKGNLDIRGYRRGNRVCLVVADDGAGMEESELEHILEKKEKKTKSNGVGVYNVQKRLQLYYGPEYGISYISRKGEGTVATVTIPLDGGKSNEETGR